MGQARRNEADEVERWRDIGELGEIGWRLWVRGSLRHRRAGLGGGGAKWGSRTGKVRAHLTVPGRGCQRGANMQLREGL